MKGFSTFEDPISAPCSCGGNCGDCGGHQTDPVQFFPVPSGGYPSGGPHPLPPSYYPPAPVPVFNNHVPVTNSGLIKRPANTVVSSLPPVYPPAPVPPGYTHPPVKNSGELKTFDDSMFGSVGGGARMPIENDGGGGYYDDGGGSNGGGGVNYNPPEPGPMPPANDGDPVLLLGPPLQAPANGSPCRLPGVPLSQGLTGRWNSATGTCVAQTTGGTTGGTGGTANTGGTAAPGTIFGLSPLTLLAIAGGALLLMGSTDSKGR
jgi:hypothetical protein